LPAHDRREQKVFHDEVEREENHRRNIVMT
jgi:hypothetical protein